jgi:hypothetical protein
VHEQERRLDEVQTRVRDPSFDILETGRAFSFPKKDLHWMYGH